MSLNHQQIQDIRNFIEKSELNEAIDLLLIWVQDGEMLNGIRLLASRLSRVEQDQRNGIIDPPQFNQRMNAITKALLDTCTKFEMFSTNEKNKRGEKTGHFLQAYPRGPMVEGHLIDSRIVESYAKLIRPELALSYINKANQLRKAADPLDERATIIEAYTLLSPTNSRPLDFWLDAFHEARLHGPRMLAALLHVLVDDQFPKEIQEARRTLLQQLKEMQ